MCDVLSRILTRKLTSNLRLTGHSSLGMKIKFSYANKSVLFLF